MPRDPRHYCRPGPGSLPSFSSQSHRLQSRRVTCLPVRPPQPPTPPGRLRRDREARTHTDTPSAALTGYTDQPGAVFLSNDSSRSWKWPNLHCKHREALEGAGKRRVTGGYGSTECLPPPTESRQTMTTHRETAVQAHHLKTGTLICQQRCVPGGWGRGVILFSASLSNTVI